MQSCQKGMVLTVTEINHQGLTALLSRESCHDKTWLPSNRFPVKKIPCALCFLRKNIPLIKHVTSSVTSWPVLLVWILYFCPYVLPQDMQCRQANTTARVFVKNYVNVTSGSSQDLKVAIAKNGPISVSIDASHKSLSFYANGVYYDPDCGTWTIYRLAFTGGWGGGGDTSCSNSTGVCRRNAPVLRHFTLNLPMQKASFPFIMPANFTPCFWQWCLITIVPKFSAK